ncbi:helix-turn-helix domain-containing protein [Clostridium chrysemydis]|uniref:helix-turn-helix domain-containing protein n=1 Tax=Clostridium chrysemydis TaxID=2665504 RepID=UPI0018838FD8|nr:helix-turn-helix domain-containing protein [Clostridium chrysemydis]
MNILYQIYTATEASREWGLNESTVRKAIQNGKFKEGSDYRKSGKVTLITKEAMEKVYGSIKK